MNAAVCRCLPLLLLALPAVRAVLESRMSLHMAVELPLLLLGGYCLGSDLPRQGTLLSRIDDGGLLTATMASCVLAYWMVPAALDHAVLDSGYAWLKYAMWIAAGALLRAARWRLGPVIRAFFLSNAAWMTCTAGLLYLDAEQQLCVNYLRDDQQLTGWALMCWGVALGAGGLWSLRPLLGTEAASPAH